MAAKIRSSAKIRKRGLFRNGFLWTLWCAIPIYWYYTGRSNAFGSAGRL